MTAPGKLPPPARPLGVLLNRCILASPHGERDGLEVLFAGAADWKPLALNLDLVGSHQLLGDGA